MNYFYCSIRPVLTVWTVGKFFASVGRVINFYLTITQCSYNVWILKKMEITNKASVSLYDTITSELHHIYACYTFLSADPKLSFRHNSNWANFSNRRLLRQTACKSSFFRVIIPNSPSAVFWTCHHKFVVKINLRDLFSVSFQIHFLSAWCFLESFYVTVEGSNKKKCCLLIIA